MKRLLITVAVVLLITNISHAGPTAFFNFSDGGGKVIGNTSSNRKISKYMTNIYGSRIRVRDAKINGKADNFLSVKDKKNKDMEIIFLDEPIWRVSGDGYVFLNKSVSSGEFFVKGYNSDFRSIEFPKSGSMVTTNDQQAYNVDSKSNGQFNFDVTFDEPVSLLVFGGKGKSYVGIDNLTLEKKGTVAVAPAPRACLLASLGIGVVGYLRRRRTI